MIKLSSSYVLIITTPPPQDSRNGWKLVLRLPCKYIFLRICSGDFGSVGYISYNVKDPVLLRGLSCAGKLHCPNVIHAKVFCSITLYVGMPQKSILYTIIIYQYIIRRFFYLLYLNFHRLILYLQKHRNNAKVLLFVFC